MSSLSLVDLPTFAFTVVPFLLSEDVLSLRRVSRRVKDTLIDDEAEAIWAAFLRADFDGSNGRQGLRVRADNFGPSVFGTTGENAIEELDSAFETWKSWKRASRRYSHRAGGGELPQSGLLHLKPKCKCRHAKKVNSLSLKGGSLPERSDANSCMYLRHCILLLDTFS